MRNKSIFFCRPIHPGSQIEVCSVHSAKKERVVFARPKGGKVGSKNLNALLLPSRLPLCSERGGSKEQMHPKIIGVLFGCFARKIDGPGLPGVFHLPGPSISPKRTPMPKLFFLLASLEEIQQHARRCGASPSVAPLKGLARSVTTDLALQAPDVQRRAAILCIYSLAQSRPFDLSVFHFWSSLVKVPKG